MRIANPGVFFFGGSCRDQVECSVGWVGEARWWWRGVGAGMGG